MIGYGGGVGKGVGYGENDGVTLNSKEDGTFDEVKKIGDSSVDMISLFCFLLPRCFRLGQSQPRPTLILASRTVTTVDALFLLLYTCAISINVR